MSACPFCSEALPEDTKRCPSCLRDLPMEAEDTYELPADAADIPIEWQGGAVYTLELPARCPHCREVIRTLRVLRLKRTQVTFTSTLPRGGRIIVCPECERIVSAELAAL